MRVIFYPACLLLFTTSAIAEEPKRIAVLEVIVEGGADPVIGSQMTARLAEVLGERPNVSVIAPDDIRAILEKEAEKQLLGCTDESCLIEIGGALGADLLVQGRVSKIEDGFGVSMSAVDAASAKALAHVSETWKGESIGLLGLIPPIVDKLLEKGSLVGAIEISGAETGSQIFIDDQIRGTHPAGQLGKVPIGARRVRVIHEDHLPFERWVVVNKGQMLTIPVAQEELPASPFYTTWWFWSVTAVGVAGAAVGTALLLSGDDPVVGGATGVNVSVNADSAFNGGR